MEKETKERFIKATFILSSLLFLVGGVEFLAKGNPIFGIIQLIAGICNGLMLKFGKGSAAFALNCLVFIFNILAAATIGMHYDESGKQYIQYVWIVAAFFSLIALLIYVKKKVLGQKWRKGLDLHNGRTTIF